MADYLIQKLLEAKGYPPTQEEEDKICSWYLDYDGIDNFVLKQLYSNANRNESYAYHSIRLMNENTRVALQAYEDLCESVKYISYSSIEEKEAGREKFLRLRNGIIRDIRRNDKTVLQSLLLIRKLYVNVLDTNYYADEVRESTNINLQYYSTLEDDLLGENYFKEMIPVYSDDVFLYKRKEIEAAFSWVAANVYSRNIKEPQESDKVKVLQTLRDYYIINNFSLQSTYFPATNEVLVTKEVAECLCFLFEGSKSSPYQNNCLVSLSKPIHEVNKTLQDLLLDKKLEL